MTDEEILELAAENQRQAFNVVKDSRVIECWQKTGAKVNLVGSLKTGLLMTHRDIDFHVYTRKLDAAQSFEAMKNLAGNLKIKKVDYVNLADEEDCCLEWHAFYEAVKGEVWQIDMIHMPENAKYAGYFEKTAERILQVMTPAQKRVILRLKYETPEDMKISGIEYYMAVLRDGVQNFDEFCRWRQQHPQQGIITWMP